MFQQLDSSWPKHPCFDIQYKNLFNKVMPGLKAAASPSAGTFKPFAGLKATFAAEGAEPQGAPTDNGLLPNPSKPSKTSPPQHVVKVMEPFAGDEQSLIGVVRDRQLKTQRMDELYAALGGIGQKAFDSPPKSSAVQLTITTTEEPNESYTAIGDRTKVDNAFKPGVLVWTRLLGKATSSCKAWIIADIESI